MTVSQELKQKYDHDGYVIIDLGLPDDLLDGIVADTLNLRLYGQTQTPAHFGHGTRVQDAWKHSHRIHQVAAYPMVLEILRELYGRKPLPFQTLNFPVGTQQMIHSDTIHFNSMPAGYMCGVWVALEDVDMDNGPLKYYPGSHKLPEITMADVQGGTLTRPFMQRFFDSLRQLLSSRRQGAGMSGMTMDAMTGGKTYADYEAFIDEMITKSQMQPDYGLLRKGQALIWSSNLLHGGSQQTDKSRTRHSQVTHCFFEKCKYYTPLLSRGRTIYWRKPQWIPPVNAATKAA